jgi:hypothetical protein
MACKGEGAMAVPNGLQWLHVDLHRSPVKQLYQNADAALGGGGGLWVQQSSSLGDLCLHSLHSLVRGQPG